MQKVKHKHKEIPIKLVEVYVCVRLRANVCLLVKTLIQQSICGESIKIKL